MHRLLYNCTLDVNKNEHPQTIDLESCGGNFTQLTILGVTQYTWRCMWTGMFHRVRGSRVWLLCVTPSLGQPTHCLQRIYLPFWRVDALMNARSLSWLEIVPT